MKTLRSQFLLSCLTVTFSAAFAWGQTSTPKSISNASSPLATLTLTFREPTADYAVFSSDDAQNRYYIQVPASNVPSYKLSDGSGAKLMVDNEKSSAERLVFWLSVQPGSTPRVELKNGNLVLTFLPTNVNLTSGSNSGSVDANPPTSQPPNAALSGASSPAPAAAPTPLAVTKDEVKDKPVEFSDADLAVPESPAFTVLGLTPQTVARPTSPRAFASSLLNGVDENGNFQSGVALDTAPYLVFAGPSLTLRKYNESYQTRFLARTQFSFGTTKGASDDDKSVRLALGFRMTLWDAGDPHSDEDLLTCFADRLKLPAPPTINPDTQTIINEGEHKKLVAEAIAGNIKGADECRAEARKRNWNRSSWIVAAAPSWISTTGQTKDLKWNGAGFWTSLAYGFEGIPALEKNSQFIVHTRYRNLEQAPDPVTKGKFIIQDSFFLGGRWRFGNENASANVEGVFQRIRQKGKVWDTSGRYSVGLERRVAENMWFGLSFGTQQGREDGKNKGFVLSSFRWGFAQKRKYNIPGLD